MTQKQALRVVRTCAHDVVTTHVHVHRLHEKHGDDLRVVVHGRVVQQRQTVLVLLAKT